MFYASQFNLQVSFKHLVLENTFNICSKIKLLATPSADIPNFEFLDIWLRPMVKIRFLIEFVKIFNN